MIKPETKSRLVPVIILITILSIYSLSLIAMYVWGFFTSLKSSSEFMFNIYGLPRGLPWKWEWKNYALVLETLHVPVSIRGVRQNVFALGLFSNSFLYAFLGALISSFTTWVVAYALARFPYKFSKFLYSLNIILMIIPIIGSLPSAMQIMRGLGLYDNWGFILVNSISFTGMFLMVFYAFIKGVGKEYIEAACVDGATNFNIMFRIMFPITAQMYFVLFIMVFIGRWNDYMTMVIWMPNYPTLAYGIYYFSVNSASEISWPPMQIAGCMMLMLPILVLFINFQSALMGNIRMGAIKG